MRFRTDCAFLSFPLFAQTAKTKSAGFRRERTERTKVSTGIEFLFYFNFLFCLKEYYLYQLSNGALRLLPFDRIAFGDCLSSLPESGELMADPRFHVRCALQLALYISTAYSTLGHTHTRLPVLQATNHMCCWSIVHTRRPRGGKWRMQGFASRSNNLFKN